MPVTSGLQAQLEYMKMIEANRNGEVWVYAEVDDGAISDVSLELLGKARQLAEQLSVQVGAALLGSGVESLAASLIAFGADKVYLSQDAKMGYYQTAPFTKTMCDLITEHKPQIVLYGASPLGRDLAPSVASAMQCGLTADCTDLQIGDHKDNRSGEVYTNLLQQIRPAFGGNIIATIVNPIRWPQMATVREGVMSLGEPDESRKGQVVELQAMLSEMQLPVERLEYHRRERTVNLKAARIIVAGGAGVGSKDNFKQLWDLAHALGGAVAGSRAAVDLGYIGHDHQVGQTGTTVRPALYIACGISGAVQHLAGMQESAKVLAINNDPDAPILSAAHYGIVGDLKDVVPMLTRAIRSGAGVDSAVTSLNEK